MIKILAFSFILCYSSFSFAKSKEKVEDIRVVKVAVEESVISSCSNSNKTEWKVANLLR